MKFLDLTIIFTKNHCALTVELFCIVSKFLFNVNNNHTYKNKEFQRQIPYYLVLFYLRNTLTSVFTLILFCVFSV